MLRCLLFDFDGTLVDSRPLAVEIINEVAVLHGYRPLRPEEVPALSRLPLKERLKLFGVPALKVPQLALELRRRYGERLAAVPVYRGMAPIVRTLSKRYRLAILSSNEPESIRQLLHAAKLEVFDPIDASFNLFGKSAKIKSFLRKTGLKRGEIVYIGDELRDIEAAKEAKVRSVAVTWGFDSRELLAKGKPDEMIDSPAQLLDLF